MLPPSQSCLCKCEHTMQHPTAEAATWKTSVERAPRTQPDPFFLLQMLEPMVTWCVPRFGTRKPESAVLEVSSTCSTWMDLVLCSQTEFQIPTHRCLTRWQTGMNEGPGFLSAPSLIFDGSPGASAPGVCLEDQAGAKRSSKKKLNPTCEFELLSLR